jgi:hypothetical protein
VYHEEIALLCARANQLRAALSGAEALAAFLRGMIDYMDSHRGLARALAKLMSNRSEALDFLEVGVSRWEHVAIARYPNVERGQKKDA